MSRTRSIIIGIIAILGIILIIGIGMWGAIQIARKLPSVFSSLASVGASTTSSSSTPPVKNGESITLSAASTTVNAGALFPLSWTHTNKAVNGSYSFRYDCATNAAFAVPPASGTGQPETIFCNQPFSFMSQSNTLPLIPLLHGTQAVPVTLYIDFTPNGASKPTVTGNLALTIEPAVATSTPSKPASGGSSGGTSSGTGASNPNGIADLSVSVVEAGTIDRTTGAFYPSGTATAGSLVGVKFVVENIGTKTSPVFTFSATLPTNPPKPYTGHANTSIPPGGRIEFTMGWDASEMYGGNGLLTITVDPSDAIPETNKTNDTVSFRVTTSQ